jgi:curved DNA-binding protein CbpA
MAYSLPDEAAEVLQEDEDDDQDEGASTSQARRSVTDTFYYDQLGVTPAASQKDIRRAYFRMSRQWHPDKTSEAKAKERFQVISEAYQVLSDPPRRRAYDAQGRQGAGEGFVDAKVFFTVLLGANALEPLIGSIRLAEMFGDDLFSAGSENSDTVADLSKQRKDAERSEARQVRRQVQLAVNLAHRLDTSGQRSGTANLEALRREAREILQSDDSVPRFLSEIGWVYRNRAELYLARRASSLGAFSLWALRLRLRSQGHKAKQNASAAKYTMRSILQLRRIVNEADGANLDGEEELPGTLAEALPTFFWRHSGV